MNETTSDREVGLAKTMLARRTGLRDRMVFSLIYAIAFGLIAGWPLAAGWFSVYCALQALEFALFGAERTRFLGVRPAKAVAMLSVTSTAYGAIAPLAIWIAGPPGLVCGSLFLAGAVLNAVLTSQRSGAAFLANVIPPAGYLVLTAVLAWPIIGEARVAVSMVAIAALIIVSATILWRNAMLGMEAQRRARAEAERRRFEAEHAAGAKSAFVAAISHELRTPISAILAGAEAIERSGADPAASKAHAELINEAGQMMRTLLNDLLDLSKMEAGRMSIETITFDLRALIDNTVAFWATEARKKGLALDCVLAEPPPQWMAGDPTRLRQILNNLFSNAIKFTDQGAVTLSLEQEQRGPYWMMRFSVTDTGCGMSSQQLGRLFNRFEQTELSTARTHGGTGLGLNISRELARLMGGDIEVTSVKGQGSTFTLDVGLVEADEKPLAADAVLPDLERPLRVLVVDDHEVNRRAVGLMLEPLGVELTTAASGEAALDQLAVHSFDLVLMDVFMPGMDGRETCRRLRAAPGPNQVIPVIACTASSEENDWNECLAAGMDAYVAKPIDAADLHATLARVLNDAYVESDDDDEAFVAA
jgi:signal transduction histidine kinase/ActR/RegA family two-component response regulator